MANRYTLTLVTVPVRVGAAMGLSLLGYKAPYVALAILIVLLAAALAAFAVLAVMMRLLRRRSRTTCARCRYRPLRIARLCAGCQTPLLASDSMAAIAATKVALVQTVAAVAWIDGQPSPMESEFLDSLISAVDLPEVDRERLRAASKLGGALSDVAISTVPPADHALLLRAAASVLTFSEDPRGARVKVYEELAAKLSTRPGGARSILRSYDVLLGPL